MYAQSLAVTLVVLALFGLSSFTGPSLSPENKYIFSASQRSSKTAMLQKQLRQCYLKGGQNELVSKALELHLSCVDRETLIVCLCALNVPIKVAGNSQRLSDESVASLE